MLCDVVPDLLHVCEQLNPIAGNHTILTLTYIICLENLVRGSEWGTDIVNFHLSLQKKV